jgi:hypothetical protein
MKKDECINNEERIINQAMEAKVATAKIVSKHQQPYLSQAT